MPNGAPAVVFDKALDALIVNLKKERFAVGRKTRNPAAPAESASWSRNVPDAIKRAVYERAQGCCEFVGDDCRRCIETGGLELDHVEGFARTHVHSVEGIRLLCHVHNLLAAEQMYGRAFLDRVRRELGEARASAPRETPVSPPPGFRAGRPGKAIFGSRSLAAVLAFTRLPPPPVISRSTLSTPRRAIAYA